jgi:hypothetical protein
MRYIKIYWLKKWVKLVLLRIKKLWEKYWDKKPQALIILITSFSQKPEVFNTYNWLALAL